jgi:hypothetical protein
VISLSATSVEDTTKSASASITLTVGQVKLVPNTLSFLSRVGATSPAKQVTISNTGASTLNISSITSSAVFPLTNDCGTSVRAGMSCTLNITFEPSAAVSRNWVQPARWRMTATKIKTRTRVRRSIALVPNIMSRFFQHRQVYRFQVHNAKLELSLQSPIHRHLLPLRSYLTAVQRDFPHHLFQNTAERSATFPAKLQPAISRKENHATRLAALVLPTSPNNKKRHETLQRFMIVNDSVTVAVEVPVFLTQEDILYYRSRGFDLDFESAVITGHIDFLQIRNGHIHILDYKPDARKETHAHVQLSIYALALARRTSLPLKFFKCGWFDEKD